MIREISLGIRHFFSATSFLIQHRLLYFYLFPLLLSVLFYIGITAAIITFSDQITAWLLKDTFTGTGNPFTGSWSFLNFMTGKFIYNAAGVMVGLLIFLLSAKFSKYLILILLSPLFAYLSEIVEEKLTGKTYDLNLFQFIKDAGRGVLIAMRNFIIEMACIALFSVLGFFGGPFAIVIIPFLWLLGAYFYGFSMMDYTCERRKMSIGKGIRYIRRYRWLAIANGGMYSILDMVPLIGLCVAPVNAVVGATTAIIEMERSLYGEEV